MFRRVFVMLLKNVICSIEGKVCVESGAAHGFYFQEGFIFMPQYEARRYLNIDSEVVITVFYRDVDGFICAVRGYRRDRKIHRWVLFEVESNYRLHPDIQMLANSALILRWVSLEKDTIRLMNLDDEETVALVNTGAYDYYGNEYRRVEGTLSYIKYDYDGNPLGIYDIDDLEDEEFFHWDTDIRLVMQYSIDGTNFYEGLFD